MATNLTDPTGNRRYVALKVLKVGVNPDGTPIYRDRGEYVPEAEEWHSNVIAAMLHTEQIGQGPMIDVSDDVIALKQEVADLKEQIVALAQQNELLNEAHGTLHSQIAKLRDAAAERAAADEPKNDERVTKLPAPTPASTRRAKE